MEQFPHEKHTQILYMLREVGRSFEALWVIFFFLIFQFRFPLALIRNFASWLKF